MQKFFPKTLSRLAAIQSSFQNFFDNRSLSVVANEFNDYRFNKLLDKDNIKLNYNKGFYNKLILYIENFDLKYDSNVFFSEYLKTKRPYKRLDIITKSILIVGASEVLQNNEINVNIIINDYIEIAKSFLNKPEVSLINAVLDKISKSKI